MRIIPVYNQIMLPEITFTFKREFFAELGVQNLSKDEELLLLFANKEKRAPAYTAEDFYPLGLTGRVVEVDEDGDVTVKSGKRMDISNIRVDAEGEITLEATERLDLDDLDDGEKAKRFEKLRKAVMVFLQRFPWGIMARGYVSRWRSMEEMATALSSYLTLSNEEKITIAAADTSAKRADLIEKAIYEFIEINNVGSEAAEAGKENSEKLYREDAIKRQISYLQNELDKMHPENVSDVRRFEKAIARSGMNETARREAEKVLGRMKQEGKNSHEYGMLYDYLDFVTSLKWKKAPAGKVDLGRAEAVLDEEHYGLQKVKRRVIEQLAVMSLNKKQSGSILLFVGAPGTGKTSIGQSIAKALGRKYVRVSLGGVRDEAEIRGHRRTYIGAMPGRIMEGIKQSGSSNPVVVLDEVDKLARDYSGDPASALLEVLDPEQNATFTDHYMNVPYDLSGVLFVCTANTVSTIPEPLLNRMEVIQFPGYTTVEKFQIARRHLLPRAMEAMGIQPGQLTVTDEALRSIIHDFTMEAGVRGLKKRMETLCRTAAVQLVKGEGESLAVEKEDLRTYLDAKPIRHDSILEEKRPGVATGLAWTSGGGEILFIETLLAKGSGQVKATGQLGDVMRESTQIALSLVKSLYPEEARILSESDVHIHVPEGAVPKDGPSAGITMTAALASLITGKAVSPEFGMTGEVSLRGNVLPIGGLPEKLMAAQRAGLKKILIPQENMEDLDDVAEEVKASLEILPVHKVTEALGLLSIPPAKAAPQKARGAKAKPLQT